MAEAAKRLKIRKTFVTLMVITIYYFERVQVQELVMGEKYILFSHVYYYIYSAAIITRVNLGLGVLSLTLQPDPSECWGQHS